jgi:hypothetical protein
MKTNGFDLAEIMREAHATARKYAHERDYRWALKIGLRQAWRGARTIAAIRRIETEREAEAAKAPEVGELRDEILGIQMKDRMTPADFAEVSRLRSRVAELSAAA